MKLLANEFFRTMEGGAKAYQKAHGFAVTGLLAGLWRGSVVNTFFGVLIIAMRTGASRKSLKHTRDQAWPPSKT